MPSLPLEENPYMKLTVSWSGGKDSAFALYRILLAGKHTVKGLHTVIDKDTGRVGLHGVREELIDQQATSLGLPLTKLYLAPDGGLEPYTRLMRTYYHECKITGIDGVLFGDIFLEDLMQFRKDLLAPSGLIPVFPLWKEDTTLLFHAFTKAGFRTVVCSANAAYFKKEDVGLTMDYDLLQSLPPNVDPCGENGEFHTFVFDGPVFEHPILFEKASVIQKTYRYKWIDDQGSSKDLKSAFWFQELLPLMASR